jgi:stage V sporulation protein G
MAYKKSPAKKATPPKKAPVKGADEYNQLPEAVELGEGLMLTRAFINPLNGDNGALKAFVDVTFNDSFVVKSLKILESSRGLFLGMPSRESSGQYYDQAFPVSKECREALETALCSAYEALQGG